MIQNCLPFVWYLRILVSGAASVLAYIRDFHIETAMEDPIDFIFVVDQVQFPNGTEE